MNPFLDAPDCNIKRFQNLLDTSVDATERRTLQRLLAKEGTKAELQASEVNRLRSSKEKRRGRIAQASLLELLAAAIRSPFRSLASRVSPPACPVPQPTSAESKGS